MEGLYRPQEGSPSRYSRYGHFFAHPSSMGTRARSEPAALRATVLA